MERQSQDSVILESPNLVLMTIGLVLLRIQDIQVHLPNQFVEKPPVVRANFLKDC